MRHVKAQFTDDEFETLKEAKGDRSWREVLLEDVAGEDTDG
jgi:hypothetical protein